MKKIKKKKEAIEEVKKPQFRVEYNTFFNMLYIVRFMLKEQKLLLLFIPISVICAPFMQYLWTILSKLLIDAITAQAEFSELLLLIGIWGAIQLVFNILNNVQGANIWWRYIYVRMKLIMLKNAKILSLNYEYLEDKDVLDIFQKASQATGGNNQGVEGMMHESVKFLQNLAVIGIGMLIMGTLSPWIILILTAFAAIRFVVINHARKKDKKLVWDVLAPWWRKNNYMTNTTSRFDAAKDIRMFNLGGWLLSKMNDLYDYRLDKQRLSAKIWLSSNLIGTVIGAAQLAFVYGWIIYGISNNQVTVANAVLYIGSSTTFFNYLTSIFNQIATFKSISREINDFRTFLEYPSKQHDNIIPLLEFEKYEFVFENVSFKYPKAEKHALKNMNITLKAGERLAVVGLNGAGKSTFIKLLLRLYEPTEGRILLNGEDIMRYDLNEYYKIFSPVFQEVELFAFPMSENISMKSPDETDVVNAEKCLRLAGFDEKLDELEKGIQTELLKVIYDDGIDLSGGEKQKLALARALYKNAPVVVLDEPTAALDALAEYKLYQDFDKLIGGKTAVYISHRLSSTRFCDAVAMFKDGEMIEYGTHEELLGKDGEYSEMFRVQSQYYVEDGNIFDKEEALVNA